MEKNLEYYMALPYTVVLKPYSDGGFFAKIEELPGCMTEGDTREEALQMIEDAKRSWLSVALEDGLLIPEPEEDADAGYSGRLVFRMPRSLHKSLANQAKSEGVSLNQLILYHLSRSIGLSKPPGH